MRPWEARLYRANSRGVSAVTAENALVQPATVAGVEISEQLTERGLGSLTLAKGDLDITCRLEGGRSRLGIEQGEQKVLSLEVTDDLGYPAVTARFGGEEQEVLDEVRAMARDMLAVPPEEWPDFVWREDLLLALKGIDEGRFYAASELKMYRVTARVMAEGDSLSFSLSQITYLRTDAVGSIDILLCADGFMVYDQRSGSLLKVENDDVRLTRRKTDATAENAFDEETFIALAGMLHDHEDEVPEELRQSLDGLVEFATDPQLPKPSLVDTLAAPVWSTELRESRRKAFASGG